MQAMKDTEIELNVLVKYLDAAVDLHCRAYNGNNLELASQYISAMTAPRELLERIDRTALELQQEISSRKLACQTVSDWEAFASFEVELRNGFVSTREQARKMISQLGILNHEAVLLLGRQ